MGGSFRRTSFDSERHCRLRFLSGTSRFSTSGLRDNPRLGYSRKRNTKQPWSTGVNHRLLLFHLQIRRQGSTSNKMEGRDNVGSRRDQLINSDPFIGCGLVTLISLMWIYCDLPRMFLLFLFTSNLFRAWDQNKTSTLSVLKPLHATARGVPL